MTVSEAKKAMLDFLKKYRGKTVLFGTLEEADKVAFVMVKSFQYFRFLPPKDRIQRTISNAEAQKLIGFAPWESTALLFVPNDIGMRSI